MEENRRVEQSAGGFAGCGATSRARYPLANSGPSERSEVSRGGDQRRGLAGRAARRRARAPGGQRSNNLRRCWVGIFKRGRKRADQECAGTLESSGMIWTKYFLIPAGYLSLALSPSLGRPTWEAANEAYQHGKYEEAEVDYLQLAGMRAYSADLCYNLGNAWFKLGDQGRAILNYERALVLNSRLEQARSNLQTALKIVGNDDQPTFRERIGVYADYFPMVASITFLIAAFCFFHVPRTRGSFIMFWLSVCFAAAF